MKSALPQRGVAGAADRDRGLVTGDDCLDQRRSARGVLVSKRERDGCDHTARMHRPLPKAVVELDPVGGGAGKESGVEQICAPGAARHRNAACRAHRREHRLGAARYLTACAGDHHADGIEQVSPRVMAHLAG